MFGNKSHPRRIFNSGRQNFYLYPLYKKKLSYRSLDISAGGIRPNRVPKCDVKREWFVFLGLEIFIYPKDPKRQYRLGKCLYEQSKYAEAEPFFRQAIFLDPEDASFQYWLASCLSKWEEVKSSVTVSQDKITALNSEVETLALTMTAAKAAGWPSYKIVAEGEHLIKTATAFIVQNPELMLDKDTQTRLLTAMNAKVTDGEMKFKDAAEALASLKNRT